MYSESEILQGISVGQSVAGSLAQTYVSPKRPHCIADAILEIHNHLPFGIKVDSLEGRVFHDSSILIRNFAIPIRAEVKTEWKHSWSYDLPQGHGLENRLDDSVFHYDLDGDLVFSAMNRQFKKHVSVRVWSWLHKS